MSLVFKILKSASTFHGVDYNEKKREKGLAEKIYFKNFGYLQDREVVTKSQFKKYLEDYSSRNGRVEKAQFHAILSCKGQAFTSETLKDYALEIMRRLGYGDNPLLIYEHRDTKNRHLHIVTTRVGLNGKKIQHDLEGKRANGIVNEILKVDAKQAFKIDLNDAFSYNFSTLPQFTLLMEQRGYKQKEEGGNILFYRHGTVQGRLSLDTIKPHLTNLKQDYKRVAQIRALIYKYQKKYDGQLKIDKEFRSQIPAKPIYHSDLTHHLQKTFGLQFVFFAAKDKEPYGYSIIDHHAKAVYKGSEIVKLSELKQGAGSSPQFKATPHAIPPSKASTDPSAITNERNDQNGGSNFGEVVDQALRDVDADSRGEGNRLKKRKRQHKL